MNKEWSCSNEAERTDPVDRFILNLKALELPTEAVDCVDKCFGLLQVSDSDSACEELSLCIEKLGQIRDESEQNVKTKSGMYLKLGFLASAFVAVIMI